MPLHHMQYIHTAAYILFAWTIMGTPYIAEIQIYWRNYAEHYVFYKDYYNIHSGHIF